MNHPVILFDGVCNLCNGAVNFIIARDPRGKYRFASLQSETGAALLSSFGMPEFGADTLVLIDGSRVRTRSDAVLGIATGLGGAWRVLRVLFLIPRPLRDLVYRAVAKSRYRLFGRKNECMLPTPELRSRFLE